MALVVPDHEKRNFQTLELVRRMSNLTLAVVKGSFFADRARRVLADNIRVVELDSAAEYFEGKYREVNGLVISAESGSAWTVLYPRFTVTNPLKGRVRVPLYILTAPEPEFEAFLQNWLTLKRADGTYDDLYDHWILGRQVPPKQKRWSVLRNVLGWVD